MRTVAQLLLPLVLAISVLPASATVACACSPTMSVPAMKSDLRVLATEQEAYHAAFGRYLHPDSLIALGRFRLSDGVTLESFALVGEGWTVTVSYVSEPARKCRITVGSGAVSDGEALCDPPPLDIRHVRNAVIYFGLLLLALGAQAYHWMAERRGPSAVRAILFVVLVLAHPFWDAATRRREACAANLLDLPAVGLALAMLLWVLIATQRSRPPSPSRPPGI